MLFILALYGFEKFLVINGHRIANLPWLQIVGEKTQRKLGITFNLFDPAYMSKEIVDKLEFSRLGHADEIETSHLLFTHPDLVDITKANDYTPEEVPHEHMDPKDMRDTLCYVPTQKKQTQILVKETGDAVKGKPSQATSKKGEKYHTHLVKRLVKVLENMRPSKKP